MKTNQEGNNLKILVILFSLGLAFHFLGVFAFPIRDVVIGLSALGIALTLISDMVRGK